MTQPGQVVLFPFPFTDKSKAKLRPALLIGKLPGNHDDWLICMISSQLHHEVKDFDEVILDSASDFLSSGLKTSSLIRIGRLAVVHSNLLAGSIGTISLERLKQIKNKLAAWIQE